VKWPITTGNITASVKLQYLGGENISEDPHLNYSKQNTVS